MLNAAKRTSNITQNCLKHVSPNVTLYLRALIRALNGNRNFLTVHGVSRGLYNTSTTLSSVHTIFLSIPFYRSDYSADCSYANIRDTGANTVKLPVSAIVAGSNNGS